MPRNYRDHQKRQLYSKYQIEVTILNERLKHGKVTQDEYDQLHEMLDERYGCVR